MPPTSWDPEPTPASSMRASLQPAPLESLNAAADSGSPRKLCLPVHAIRRGLAESASVPPAVQPEVFLRPAGPGSPEPALPLAQGSPDPAKTSWLGGFRTYRLRCHAARGVGHAADNLCSCGRTPADNLSHSTRPAILRCTHRVTIFQSSPGRILS